MRRDVRNTQQYKEADALYRALRRPGTGQVSDAAQLDVATGGGLVVFAGSIAEEHAGASATRVCSVDTLTGDLRVLTFGPHTDRLPKFSPDGRCIAFLSDRAQAGDYQLHLLNRTSGTVTPTPRVEGWVEYLEWSPDGQRILLGVAGHGADVAGGQGGVTTKQAGSDSPAWMPTVEAGDEAFRWRTLWVYDLATDRVRRVSGKGYNIWEAVWCGNDAFAAVVSRGPGEALWYSATLHVAELSTGNSREVYTPRDQLGWPHASPSGGALAIVDAVCSDRGIVAGDLYLIDTASGDARHVDTRGVDVSCTQWCSDQKLLVAGHRGLETVVGLCDRSGTFTETWSSSEITTGGPYARVAGFNAEGDCALIGEGYLRAPEIATIRQGHYAPVRSFELGGQDLVKDINPAQQITWRAADGLQIEGWLLTPRGDGPHPTIMHVHGGPVWHWRPAHLGRRLTMLMLLRRGYAVFLPNPRGSSGRGREFARRVVGDVGGADASDCLSGLDFLVERGISAPDKIGVTGGSYGGFMTSWLIAQDARFAAAVSVAPHTNHVTAHLLSYIPEFVRLFVADTYTNAHGGYFDRSPIMYAHRVRTPTLNICGALDRSAPPAEARQFHNALLENAVESELVTYPEEGHGVRSWPAVADYSVRVVEWFERHIRP